jgi:hypothetical protein
LTYGTQSETLNIYLSEGYPLQFGSIIVGFHFGFACYMAQEKKIESVYVHPRVMVNVGDRELVFDGVGIDVESGFFLDFPHHALFGVLVVIYKSARQVECALGRFLASCGY